MLYFDHVDDYSYKLYLITAETQHQYFIEWVHLDIYKYVKYGCNPKHVFLLFMSKIVSIFPCSILHTIFFIYEEYIGFCSVT